MVTTAKTAPVKATSRKAPVKKTPAKTAPPRKRAARPKAAVPTHPEPIVEPPKPRPPTATESVDRLLATFVLDEAGEAKASIARILAIKLDQSMMSDSGSIAMATGGIAKELREVLDVILAATTDEKGFIADIFTMPTAVGHS